MAGSKTGSPTPNPVAPSAPVPAPQPAPAPVAVPSEATPTATFELEARGAGMLGKETTLAGASAALIFPTSRTSGAGPQFTAERTDDRAMFIGNDPVKGARSTILGLGLTGRKGWKGLQGSATAAGQMEVFDKTTFERPGFEAKVSEGGSSFGGRFEAGVKGVVPFTKEVRAQLGVLLGVI